jgi:DNA invertase Pin-like site-specific DNA recombinase
MSTGKRHAAIYVRISQDTEGTEAGVQRQEHDCRELADRMGLHVVDVYRDNDIGASSKSTKARPAYKRMLDDVRAGKFSTILAYSNSRITRRPLEWEELISLADSNHKLQVHTVASSSADFSTADGRMILRYLAAADAAEAERMGERIARAKLDAVKHGRYRGGARPFGYESDGVTPREPEFSAIAEASRRFIAGESLNSIAKDFAGRGFTGTINTQKKLTRDQLREILKRPRNAALMEHRGKIVGPASWPAAVSEEVFTTVKRKLEDPSRVTNRGRNSAYHLGSSTYLCGICGSIMRVGKSSSGSYRVYRCKAKSHLSRKVADVDEVVRSVISTRLDAADIPLVDSPDDSDNLQAERDELAALRARREQSALDYADGLLDGSQLRIATARLDEQIKDAEEKITQQVSGSVLSELVTADQPGQVFLEAPVGTQRAILDALVTVTIMPIDPAQRGSKVFDPSTIHFEWKGQDNG